MEWKEMEMEWERYEETASASSIMVEPPETAHAWQRKIQSCWCRVWRLAKDHKEDKENLIQ